jgi:hypothetical protein
MNRFKVIARDLIYDGKVDHGFGTGSAKDLQTRLKPLVRKTQQDDRAPAASSRAAMLERYLMRW